MYEDPQRLVSIYFYKSSAGQTYLLTEHSSQVGDAIPVLCAADNAWAPPSEPAWQDGEADGEVDLQYIIYNT